MGQQGVTCIDCHGTHHKTAEDAVRASLMVGRLCERCHPTEMTRFKSGKHAQAWTSVYKFGKVLDLPPEMIDAEEGCGGIASWSLNDLMGLSINGTLVLPRIIGLIIAVPMLTALSNLSGIAGAWVVSVTMLGLSADQFATRLADAVELKTVLVGLSKAPVFAVLIGAVGTLRGLQVKSSAEELGRLTRGPEGFAFDGVLSFADIAKLFG